VTQYVTSISPLGSHPYVTNDEYRQAPTAVDIDDLVGGGTYALNEVELGNTLARSSSWADGLCGQVLSATVDTETFRCRASRDGFLRLHPRFWPIVAVQDAAFGSNPQKLQGLDPSTAWIEQMAVTFPLVAGNAAFLGQIQFNRNYQPYAEQFVSITYVNGYANALSTADTAVAVTNLPVSDLTGFVPGLRFTMFDGEHTEILTVDQTHVPASGPGNVILATPTVNAHSPGVSVSALPPAVKLAVIYLTNVILKSRGNAAVVMSQLTPASISRNPAVADDYSMALELLKPYRRVR